MKTKTIPFNLETARKIQAGEIKGRITTQVGKDVRIICTDKVSTDNDSQTQIVCLVRVGARDFVSVNNPNTGRCWDIEDGCAQDLVLEVPDDEPQFKVGDKVRVKPNDTHNHFVKQYDNCIGKIVGINHESFVVIVTGAFQARFTVDELELVEETGKHELKPFDKVLVTQNGWGYWIPNFYRNKTPDGKHICIDNLEYDKCLPYEGNKHLVGTTNKPYGE